MANEEQLARLKASIAENNGCLAWNQWRKEHPDEPIDIHSVNLSRAHLAGVDLHDADLKYADFIAADLTHADLSGAHLSGVKLSDANLSHTQMNNADLSYGHLGKAHLSGAILRNTNFKRAYLSGADCRHADFRGADFSSADLRDTNLSGADLTRVDLTGVDLTHANLTDANLSRCILVETNLTNARIANARIYGIAVWNVRTEGADQTNLRINQWNEPVVTVDNLEVAQFIYLLLNNRNLRKVISTMAHKAVLILGRFTEERLHILNAIRDALRAHDYLPILFDFEKAPERDYTETVVALVHLCRFVIADLTDPRSIQQELAAFVSTLEIPVQPIIDQSQQPWGLFNDFRRKYHWVLPPYEYADLASLMVALPESVLAPAEAKTKEIQRQPW